MNKLILMLAVFMLCGFDSADFYKRNNEFIKIIKGHKIDVVAPASGKDSSVIDELDNINGVNLSLPKNCFQASKEVFHSASDEIRLKCLINALRSDDSNIIWALRGGYGSAKIIEGLSKLPKPSREKFFIGCSDITALHLFLTQRWGWKTIHGAGIAEILDKDKASQNFVKIAKILDGETNNVVIEDLIPLNNKAVNNKVTGALTGGNLTMVITSVGTPWQIITKDKILFLEEVRIKPYQLDRSLYHLKQAGLLNEVKAIIFGEFTEQTQENLKVLEKFASVLNIPVFKSNRFGHMRYNDPIIYNTDSTIELNSGKTYTLTMKLK